MEDFTKVSLILSFCHHISKASDKTGALFWMHQWVAVLPGGWLMPVSCCQFDCSVKQLNSTCVCCFLLLLVLLLNELLTHCSFVNLCRSMKKSFQGQGGSQCDTFLLRFRTMMPFQEWIFFSFRMNGFCLSCIVLTDVSWCLPSKDWRCNSERTALFDCTSRFVSHVMWNTGSWIRNQHIWLYF